MKKILVLDDDLEILKVITLILEMEGYEVRGIRTGYDLLDSVNLFHPDLILLDVMLGEHDGRVLCHDLKSSPLTESIPVIMISASHDMMKMPERFCKPDDFIAKPFDIYDLLEKVSKNLIDDTDLPIIMR
jgi:DNA-binding response OmpR family regulator